MGSFDMLRDVGAFPTMKKKGLVAVLLGSFYFGMVPAAPLSCLGVPELVPGDMVLLRLGVRGEVSLSIRISS